MSQSHLSGYSGTALHSKSVSALTLRAADWLRLAAAPSFAIMALLTSAFGGHSDMFCMHNASPFGGMAPMYLLMAAFHLPAWLTLMSRRRR